MSTNISYEEFINKLLAEPERVFAPFALYDADGDCIEFFIKPDPHFGDRIDDVLTVYRSRETNAIVGALVEGVSSLCKGILGILPGFKVEAHDGKLPLAHIFRARLWSLRDDREEVVQLYKFLAEKADEFKAEVEDTKAKSSDAIGPKLTLWSLFAKSA